MELDAVRELKESLFKPSLAPLVAQPMKLAALAMGARSVKDVDLVQRSFALGIAHHTEKGYRLAVRIQSRALERSPEVDAIVRRARGEAEVRYVGRVVKQADPDLRGRQRPLIVGCSIGHFRITAGTLGCFVTLPNGQARILSNNHVLANENAAKKGDAVIQPGDFDGGEKGKDTVGQLERFIRLKRKGPNLVDAALATVKAGIAFDAATLPGIGALKGGAAAPVTKGTKVHKTGRTTGTTAGRVTAFELDNVVVSYDLGNLRFDNQIEIEGARDDPFSQGGDSGSLIVDDGGNAVALLFAGGDQGGSNGKGLTYANPIDAVLGALRVSLLF